jgi:cell wall-associated NlpC family hydrolase
MKNQAQFRTLANLNLYSSPELTSLTTQSPPDRLLTIDTSENSEGILPPTAPLVVKLVADSYPGWLDPQDWSLLVADDTQYRAPTVTIADIHDRLPQAIAFAQAAMNVQNEYLWGGTVAPHYDCSGLMQAAFLSVGIQLPRDAYQQEGFLAPIGWTGLPDLLGQLLPGDLVFFGTPQKATHVGLYLGDQQYIHSSGRDHGRNGIGVDRLSCDAEHPVSRHYAETLRGAGRVVQSYVGLSEA